MAVRTEVLLPRYRSPRLIGRGAIGDIYAATDEVLGRKVVVKLLADRYAPDAGIRERFKREGLAAARLSGQPGAVTIFDVGEWEGRPFIVMEHLAGGSLEQRIRQDGAQPPGRALAWLEQAATALDASARPGGCAPSCRMRCSSDPPARCSMTMNGRPSHSPTSKIVTAPGWPESRAAARPSRLNRSLMPAIWRVALGEQLDNDFSAENLVGRGVDVAHRSASDQARRAVSRG